MIRHVLILAVETARWAIDPLKTIRQFRSQSRVIVRAGVLAILCALLFLAWTDYGLTSTAGSMARVSASLERVEKNRAAYLLERERIRAGHPVGK